MLYKPFSGNCSITAAGKEKLKALDKRVIEVAKYVNGKLEHFTLNDVWYVPNISCNLFLVLAAHDRNPASTFDSDQRHCRFAIDSKIIFTGTCEPLGTLYQASFHTVQPQEMCVNMVKNRQTLQLCYERWGHMDKRYVRVKLESDLSIKVKSNVDICEPCQFEKAHWKPFGTRVRTTSPSELLSGDVCGSFDPSFNKRRYLIVITDHY